jgi:hypothetical protein
MFPSYGGRPRLPQLESPIKRQINLLTSRRIQSLDVEVIGNRIIVRGCASCYYHKQLALRAVLDSIGDAEGVQVDLQIEVSDSGTSQAGSLSSRT